jgi:hypothetical protein
MDDNDGDNNGTQKDAPSGSDEIQELQRQLQEEMGELRSYSPIIIPYPTTIQRRTGSCVVQPQNKPHRL